MALNNITNAERSRLLRIAHTALSMTQTTHDKQLPQPDPLTRAKDAITDACIAYGINPNEIWRGHRKIKHKIRAQILVNIPLSSRRPDESGFNPYPPET